MKTVAYVVCLIVWRVHESVFSEAILDTIQKSKTMAISTSIGAKHSHQRQPGHVDLVYEPLIDAWLAGTGVPSHHILSYFNNSREAAHQPKNTHTFYEKTKLFIAITSMDFIRKYKANVLATKEALRERLVSDSSSLISSMRSGMESFKSGMTSLWGLFPELAEAAMVFSGFTTAFDELVVPILSRRIYVFSAKDILFLKFNVDSAALAAAASEIEAALLLRLQRLMHGL